MICFKEALNTQGAEIGGRYSHEPLQEGLVPVATLCRRHWATCMIRRLVLSYFSRCCMDVNWLITFKQTGKSTLSYCVLSSSQVSSLSALGYKRSCSQHIASYIRHTYIIQLLYCVQHHTYTLFRLYSSCLNLTRELQLLCVTYAHV